MNAKNMACIRCVSFANPWIDCLIFVPENLLPKAETALKDAIDVFESDDNQSPYGECIECEMSKEGIPYFIEYCEYDESNDEPLPSWETRIQKILECKSLTRLTVCM